MPTNVTAEYAAAEAEYSRASTKEEKVKALEKMYATVPKHKGTEKLRQQIKTKLSRFRADIEKEAAKKAKGHSVAVKKEGAATVMVTGPPSSGKSSLINALCGSKLEVGAYCFTTKKPEVAVMKYKDVKLQMVEIPAITEGYSSSAKGRQFMSIARTADLILIVTHIPGLDNLLKEFRKANILLNEKGDEEMGKVGIPGLIVQNKTELPDSDKTYQGLCKYYQFDIVRVSGIQKRLNRLKQEIWQHLGLVKIYTKEPGKKAKMSEPLTLEKGSTIEDMAEHIHKDFIRKFRFARVWGKSAKFEAQRVGLNHRLADDDVVELHMR
ncbi:TGS domain-containing protein [Candidatus Woesearchaeota archaeon]|nr:TGS domain-containing protein [Candidatus Woesearchaeota archaeon]